MRIKERRQLVELLKYRLKVARGETHTRHCHWNYGDYITDLYLIRLFQLEKKFKVDMRYDHTQESVIEALEALIKRKDDENLKKEKNEL